MWGSIIGKAAPDIAWPRTVWPCLREAAVFGIFEFIIMWIFFVCVLVVAVLCRRRRMYPVVLT